MKKLLMLFSCFVVSLLTLAQTYDQSVIPPSPRAESFHIYGDIPVDHSTGVPDISIPLYTIESDGVQVPIILRYHVSSIKPGRDDSNVAFGWTLDVGGRISRTVYGMPDEYVKRPATFRLSDDLNPFVRDDFDYLNKAIEGGDLMDTQYDLFSYQAMGQHGEFIINNQEGSIPTIHKLRINSLKIDFSTAINNDFSTTVESINQFTVVNGLGQTYYFGENNMYEAVGGSSWGSSPSSWLLTKIKNSKGVDAINFSYASIDDAVVYTNALSDNYGSALDYIYLWVCNAPEIEDPDFVYEYCNTHEILEYGLDYNGVKTIKEITFKNGKVIFNLTTESGRLNKRIESIEIKDDNNDLIKTINFVKTFFYDPDFPDQTEYEKLESIEITDGTVTQIYEFEYFDYGMPNSTETDFWGYYNNRDNYAFSRDINILAGLADQSISCKTLTNQKDAVEDYSKSYVLNKIIYPTGGYTEFDYELNQFTGQWSSSEGNQNETINGGGLRINSIVSKRDESSTGIVKTYEYQPRHFGEEDPNNPLNPYNYTKTRYYVSFGSEPCPYRYRNRTFSHSFNSNLKDTYVNYEVVTEYLGTTSASLNTGKTVYTYEYDLENVYWPKTVIPAEYLDGFDFGTKDLNNQSGLGYNKLTEYRDGGGGKLRKIEHYKSAEGSYYLIKEIINTYDYKNSLNLFYNLIPVKICSYGQGDNLNDFTYRDYWYVSSQKYVLPVLGSYDSYIYQCSDFLKKKEVRDIQDDGSEIITTTDYTYNDNGFIVSQETTNSNNKISRTEIKYPYEINTGIYSDMIDANMLNYPVEKITKVDGKIAASNLTTYKDDEGNYVPDESYKLELTAPLLPTSFDQFDGISKDGGYGNAEVKYIDYNSEGKLIKALTKDRQYQYFVWAYNGEYPVAKIVSSKPDLGILSIQQQIDGISFNKSDELNKVKQDVANLKAFLPTNDADCMVTIYTYKPLVGMTSQTDPSGRTTYYEYDNFGRLEYIRDHNGNIINRYDYHYAGQQ